MDGTQKYLLIREVCERLGVSADTVERWVRTGKVKVMRIGKQIIRPARIHVSEVERIERSGVRRPKQSIPSEPDVLGIYAERGR